jgi:hypothetical protein
MISASDVFNAYVRIKIDSDEKRREDSLCACHHTTNELVDRQLVQQMLDYQSTGYQKYILIYSLVISCHRATSGALRTLGELLNTQKGLNRKCRRFCTCEAFLHVKAHNETYTYHVHY